MVTGTTGNDEITLSGQTGDVTVDLLAGDDLLHVPVDWANVDATATIHGDDGYDTLDLTGLFLSATGSGFSGQIVTQYNGVTLTDNWDGIESVHIGGTDISTSHSFVTGDSDDTIFLLPSQNGQTVDITTNGGDDSVTLSQNVPSGIYYSGTIDVGVGNDVVDLHLVTGNGGVADAFDIFGGAGADSLRGSAGPDTLHGGDGDDAYYVPFDQDDTVVELANEGIDTVYTNGNYTLTDNFENLLYFQFGNLDNHAPSFLTGNALDNHIVGSGGTTIDGGAGADTMENGLTYYVDNVGDVVIEGEGASNEDTVYSSVTYTIGDNIENLRLTGNEAIDGTGNAEDNDIFGNSAVNTLTGGDGNDRLIGGLGNDTLIGGNGDDYYEVEQAGDVVVELGGIHDFDKVVSHVTSYTLTSGVEVLTLVAGVALNGTGNALVNYIETQFNHDDNVIDGGAGADTMRGGGGDDTYYVDDPFDQILDEMSTTLDADAGTDTIYSSASSYTMAKNIEIMILTGAGNINATGNAIANQIDGNSGNNVIDGSFGADTMRGGAGDDTYYVDNPGDIAYEGSAANGNDTVFSTISYTIGSAIETLVLLGSGNTSGTGNNSANHIVGNSGNNVIDGRMGADTMEGGLGNDTYYVDYSGDVVVEASGGGTDTVRSSYYSHTLAANVENLILVAGSAARTGTGNNLANVIDGNEFANVLDGMGGADTMRGGNGDDTYYVDNPGDVAYEASAAGGNDRVNSSASSFTLGVNVESLYLTGTGNISGSGNSLDNFIQGNSGNNSIDGKVGYDTMAGGLGDDGYYVDSSHDVVIENAGAGNDTVRSSASAYILAANVENLILIGSAATGFGNNLDNFIYGNDGDNLINGGAGADTMAGGRGDDTYVVDNVLDVINETSTGLDPNAGDDTVRSSVSYTLAKNVENLVLTTGNTNGTGNGLDNALTGSSGNNTLDGLLGNDTLDGGSGLDRFLFDTALNSTTNVDDILNFSIADDTILLDRSIFTQAGANGTLAASAFRLGSFAQDPDDRIIYDPGSGNIFYDADGNGAGTALLFAHVTPGLVLSAADFLIVP
jgi:Ca2+-binding RTX toxin-like protein